MQVGKSTVLVTAHEIIVTFQHYGTTRFSIEPVNSGLLITTSYAKGNGLSAEFAIGTTAVDRHTLEVVCV